MIEIILGNFFALLAMISDSISSSRKTTKGMLKVQNFSQLFYGISSVILKGYSGAVQNLISLIRNILAIKENKKEYIQWILLGIAVVLGVAVNKLGIIGYFPIIANVQYTIVVLKVKNNEKALKISFLISCILFTIFNAIILNIIGIIANIIIIISIIMFLFKKNKNIEFTKQEG